MRECFKLGIMGCLPSKRRENDSSSTGDDGSEMGRTRSTCTEETRKPGSEEKPTLTPTIQMVNEETLKLLQEIGELRVFHTANNTDHSKNIARHQDIILALENPSKANSVKSNTPANLK